MGISENLEVKEIFLIVVIVALLYYLLKYQIKSRAAETIKSVTEIILDSSKQDHLLIPKHHMLFCIRVFDNIVPSARKVQPHLCWMKFYQLYDASFP